MDLTSRQWFLDPEIMIKAQEAGRDGQARAIESTFTPPSFFDEHEQLAEHLIHDRANQ